MTENKIPFIINGIEILERFNQTKGKRWRYKAICFCGKEFLVQIADLKNKGTKSCGCHRRRICIEKNITHGKTNLGVYYRWGSMIDRCVNPKNKQYNNYGGRGITIEDARWFNIEEFEKDIGVPPFKGAQLDRIDNSKGYCKENCRWVTSKENNRNKRNNRIFWGVKFYLIMDICNKFGIKSKIIYERFNKCGWSLDRCLNTPVKGKEKIWLDFKNEMLDLYKIYN